MFGSTLLLVVSWALLAVFVIAVYLGVVDFALSRVIGSILR